MAPQHSPRLVSGKASNSITNNHSGRRQNTSTLLAGVGILCLAMSALAGTTVKSARQPVSSDQKISEAQRQVPSPELIRKTRQEFDKLGLQMVGMTSIMDEATALIKFPGASEPMFCSIGQVVGGFKILSIQTEYTVFEGNGIRIWLALGSNDSGSPAVLETTESNEAVGEHKESASVKTYYQNGKPVSSSSGKIVKNVGEELITYNGKSVSVASLGSSGRDPQFVLPLVGRVTSDFGYRKQPTGGARKYHQGVDIQGKLGSPIAAAADGVVEEVSRSWAKGLNILVRHSNGFHTAYFHLSKTLVKEGQSVKQGSTIGLEGNTGITTGPHLHFEIHKNGTPVDPSLYLKTLKK